MKYPGLFALFVSLLLSFCKNTSSSPVGHKPEPEVAQELLAKIIRYTGHLPKKANHETKFDSIYDQFYASEMQKHRIDLYYQDEKTGEIYLLVSRIAPSLSVKRVATGIRMRMEGDSIVYYEEVFRTWKMPEPELAEKGALLYRKMVRGEDLKPYLPQYSGKEEYIEFPDEHTRFDVERRRWVTDLEVHPEQIKETFQQLQSQGSR